MTRIIEHLFDQMPTTVLAVTADLRASAHHPPQPARRSAIGRSLRARCPVCASKQISRHPAHVHQRCPNCDLDLERQVGSFIGGIGVNTVLAFGLLLLVIVFGFIGTGGEASVTKILLPALGVALFVPLLFYARSRLLWVAIELIWWPLGFNETTTVL